MDKYTPPLYKKSAFNCPNCGAYSNQKWYEVCFHSNGYHTIDDLEYCVCSHCHKYSFWRKEKMLFPSIGNAPFANADLPKEIKEDYEEARAVLTNSPSASAALLRLTIQKICKYLGEKGKNLNTDIESLVKKGLPEKIEESLRMLRVIGRGAIPPGKIDFRDDTNTAEKLFTVVNLIADVMISQPDEINMLLDSLPPEKLT